MHPGDNTCAAVVYICFIKGLSDELISDKGGLPYYLIGKDTALIELVYDNF